MNERYIVSVPIRGLFNLTSKSTTKAELEEIRVSVPIRGLFNLTHKINEFMSLASEVGFPSPSGDYLI